VIAVQRPAVKPPPRGPVRLSVVEREEISRGLVAGLSLRAIARQLGRSPSTISPEVRANGGASRYRAHRSDRRAVRLARRPKLAKLALNAQLREVVEAKLALRWSPQQISGWLKLTYPDEPEMGVSHESIYLSLFIQSRGALRKELAGYLRTGRAHRRPAGLSVHNGQGQLRGVVHISERPAQAEDRAVPGHWEGDLIFGKSYSAIATLVERKTRFVMLIRLPHRNTADAVADALADAVVTLPEQLRRSITWDQGKRWPNTHASASPAESRSTSAIRAARGSAAATRTPTVCSVSTSPDTAPTFEHPVRPTSTTLLPNSTAGLDKHSAGEHHHKH
jgi:IS30 family transposase